MKKRISAYLTSAVALMLSAITAISLSVCSFAAGTYDADEMVDISAKCTLTLNYEGDGYQFIDKTVEIYKVADISADMVYSLSEQFKDYQITFSGNMTQDEYSDLASTLYGYAWGDEIVPTASGITDEDGKVTFTGIDVGLYLISAVKEVANDTVYSFKESIIAVPNLDTENKWSYDVTANIKFESEPVPHSYRTYTMSIIWDDMGFEDIRPDSVDIDIICDGKTYDKINVSSTKDWEYSWKVQDDVYTWGVAARNIPEGYTVRVHFVGEHCQIIYTYVEAPQTGDTSDVIYYAVGMLAAGAALAVIGFVAKKKTVKEV